MAAFGMCQYCHTPVCKASHWPVQACSGLLWPLQSQFGTDDSVLAHFGSFWRT